MKHMSKCMVLLINKITSFGLMKNPQKLHSVPLHGEKITVWYVLSGHHGLSSPIFAEETMHAQHS